MRYANIFAKVLADILGQNFLLFISACLRHEYPWIIEQATIKRSNRRDTLFCTGGISMSKSSNSFVCVDVGRGCKNLLHPRSLAASPGRPIFLRSRSGYTQWHSINIYLRLGGLFRERAACGRSFIRSLSFSEHTQTGLAANPPTHPAAMNHLKNKTWHGLLRRRESLLCRQPPETFSRNDDFFYLRAHWKWLTHFVSSPQCS